MSQQPRIRLIGVDLPARARTQIARSRRKIMAQAGIKLYSPRDPKLRWRPPTDLELMAARLVYEALIEAAQSMIEHVDRELADRARGIPEKTSEAHGDERVVRQIDARWEDG